MAEDEVKTGDSVSKESEEDSAVLTEAMVGKEGATLEETKEKTEKKPEEDLPKVEEKAEKPEEKAEVKAPDEIEVQTQKLFDKFKGDPKGLAKALANQYSLSGRHDQELGDLRKRGLEYDTLIKKMHEDPEGVKQDLDALHKKEKEESSLLDRAFDDPKELPRYIESKVDERLNQIESQRELEKELAKSYPNFEQSKSARENLKQQIEVGRFSPDEVLQLAVDGFYAKEQIGDAKENARKEDRETLAKKAGAEIDKQGVIDSEKKPQTDEEVLTDALMEAKR